MPWYVMALRVIACFLPFIAHFIGIDSGSTEMTNVILLAIYAYIITSENI